MAFRTLFALAAYFDLDIDQMDVKMAFLYGLIEQLIYMEVPKGTETEATKNMACKLLKAPYGLKQSRRLLLANDLLSSGAELSQMTFGGRTTRGPMEMRSQTSFLISILFVSIAHIGQLMNPVSLSRVAWL